MPDILFMEVQENESTDSPLKNLKVSLRSCGNCAAKESASDAESLSIYALSKIFTGKPLERVFWVVIVISTFSIVVYATTAIISEFLDYEIRTEIRVVEKSHIQLPDLVICDPEHYYVSGLSCHDGKSLYDSASCNASLQFELEMKYKNEFITPNVVEYVSQPHICVRLNNTGLHSELEVDVFPVEEQHSQKQHTRPMELDLFFVDQAIMNAGSGGESVLNRLPMAHYQIDIFERIIYRRLKTPYPSRCSDGEGMDLVFPGNYTIEKCEASHRFWRMLKKCGTVLDPWKSFIPDQNAVAGGTSRQNETYRNISGCLVSEFVYSGPFPCPLQCEEVIHKAKEFLFHPSQDRWHFHIRYSPRRMTVINEVPNYPLVKVFSDIGGWLGFFVGISLLSLIEIAVYIVHLVKKKCFVSKIHL